jgi:hypothetical protein
MSTFNGLIYRPLNRYRKTVSHCFFLHVLDWGHWTRVFELANSNTPATIARLTNAIQKLVDLNQCDALEMTEARANTGRMEEYLKSINFGGKQSSTFEHPKS